LSIEIERKFLVTGNAWRKLSNGIIYKQGYISTDKEHTIRIRVIETKAFLTIKGKSIGTKRIEFEYEIPFEDAVEMLNNFCLKPIIEKARYKIQYKGLTWEVDEFFGNNTGLILAEVELQHEDQKIEIPDWIGSEVTGDPKYYNVNLINHPFINWDISKILI
jgi:CYTH domain-containing protein